MKYAPITLATETDDNEQDSLHYLKPGQYLETSASITVAVRVRPLLAHEEHRGHSCIIKCDSKANNVQVIDPRDFGGAYSSGYGMSPEKSTRMCKEFEFDQVLNEQATQFEVFNATSRSLCSAVLNGYNGTILAYGATGAGKTHTMIGASEHS